MSDLANSGGSTSESSNESETPSLRERIYDGGSSDSSSSTANSWQAESGLAADPSGKLKDDSYIVVLNEESLGHRRRRDQPVEKDADGKLVVKRKSHRKSKTGCITCRQRRVKCDEQLPVCANCVRHRVRCDYESLTPFELRDRYLSQLVDKVIAYLSRRTLAHIRPFTTLRPFQCLNNTDIRLLQHISMLATRFVAVRPEHAVIWKEVGIQNTHRQPYLLHAFLALSAAHAGNLVQSPDLFRVALEHKTIALRGAHEALASFGRDNAEGVLAVSMLLCWQAFYTEDRDPTGGSLFASLAHGIYTVLLAMGPWRDDFPLATLYFYTVRPESWPPPLPPEDFVARENLIMSLKTHVSRLQPLCLDTVNPIRRFCFTLLLHELDVFLGYLAGGLFDTLSHEEQMRITEPFSRWQKCFAPTEAGPSNKPVGYRGTGSTPISDSILQAYSDPVTRLIFAYFYATGLLIDGLWPPVRRSGSIVTRLGPLESILRGLSFKWEWWANVDGYAFFATRVVDCFKVRSWLPISDLAAQIELPPRVTEVLWYGLMESSTLNLVSAIP